MIVVGLTGGIASGKSTVSRQLAEKHHLTVVDADVIAREVVSPGKPAYTKILSEFGPEIPDLVKDDKSLNREALGRHVFGNKARLGALNGIVHPAVRHEIGRQIMAAYFKLNRLVVLDIPLLFEAKLHMICGKTIVVSCDRDTQVERLMARNPELGPEDAENRINSQMSTEEKCFKADLIIDNSKGLEELEGNVALVVGEITPGWFFTAVDLVPPLGLLSAFLTVLTRYFRDKFRGEWKKEQ